MQVARKQNTQTQLAYKTIIIGLGKTGLSCARFLAQRGELFALTDNRSNPPCLDEVQQSFPDAPVYVQGFNREAVLQAERLVVSPGVSLQEPVIAEAIEQGKDPREIKNG